MSEDTTAKEPGPSTSLYRFRFGRAEFDESRGELWVDGALVAVEPRPLAVLAELLHRPDEVVTKEELFQSVWAGQPTVDNVVANAIAKLRKVLREVDGVLIVNIPRVGYRLSGKVERVAAGRRAAGKLNLAVGQAVPGRDAYVLEAPLGPSHPGSEVWLARHLKLREARVFKFAADGERLAALKREYTLHRVLREGLGDRDDFVRILEINLAEPPFYLECEYGGKDMVAWAAAGEMDSLGRPERISLFLQIARSVADAHNVGVLHKDLKPSNVLVERRDGRWHTRLTDFGSGRLLEPGRLASLGITALGLTTTQGVTGDARTGTVLYLAPELLAGQAPSAQSDLYALGLMLFQMLVGDFSRPITPGWERGIDDELLQADIVAATNAHPASRLSSVAAFIERLDTLDARRAQTRQSAEAQAAAARAAQAAQRARLLRPWLLTLGIVLTAGLATTTWQWRRAEGQRQAAEAAANEAEATLEFLKEDVLGASDPLAGKTALPVTVQQALLTAADRIDTRFQRFQAVRGQVSLEMSNILSRYGEVALSQTLMTKAIQDLTTSFGPQHPKTITARYAQAMLLSRTTLAKQSTELLSQADAALALTPIGPTRLRLQVLSQMAHGVYLTNTYQRLEAVGRLEAALQGARALQPVDTQLLDRIYAELTALYPAVDRAQDGLSLVRAWQADLQGRTNAAPNMGLVAQSRLAAALVTDNQLDEAQALLKELTPAMTTLLGKTSTAVITLRSLDCEVLSRRDMMRETIRCSRTLFDDIRSASNLPPAFPWTILGNIGIMEVMLHDWPAAERSLSEALTQLTKIDGAAGIQANVRFHLIQVRLHLNDLTGARELRQHVNLAAAQSADPVRPWGPRLTVIDAMIAQRQGRKTEAQRLFEQGRREYEMLAKERGVAIEEDLYDEAGRQLGKAPAR